MKRGRYFMRGRKSRADHNTGPRGEDGSSSGFDQGRDQRSSGSGRGPRYEPGSSGSWMTPEPRSGRGGRDQPPQGLRGKAISSFYRDKVRERYKQQKGGDVVKEKEEFVMALRLPSSVVKRVEKLLNDIYEKRKDELCLQAVFKCPQNYKQKQDPFEDFNSSAPCSPFGSQTGEHDNLDSVDNSGVVLEGNDCTKTVTNAILDFIPINLDEFINTSDAANATSESLHGCTDRTETSDDDCVILETPTPLVQLDNDDVDIGVQNVTNPKTHIEDDDCFIFEPPPCTESRLRPFYTEKLHPETNLNFAPVNKQEPIITSKINTPEYIPLGSKTSLKRVGQLLPSEKHVFPKLPPKNSLVNRKSQNKKSKTRESSSTWFLEKQDSKRPSANHTEQWTRFENVTEPQYPGATKKEKKDVALTISVADLNTAKRYRPLPLRHEGQQYKYGYHDIITGSFMEKLDECLSKGISILEKSPELDKLSGDYYRDFIHKINTSKYKEMLKFRERLPAYKKRKELLDQINSTQVVVISGDTGCGKSTQVPQIIIDEAIQSKHGANVKIVVTQPRRIAASSLALRVSEERAESLGESVGYVVRLERMDARPRGSITYCTTGVLLAELETNQALATASHIVLDEVHERDATVDLAMCMLKQVISKRKDLKLILMSATLDAESLSRYFDNCPTMHIEGLAYPVTDIYMEDILKLTGFTLPPVGDRKTWHGPSGKKVEKAEKDLQYKMEMGPMLDKDRSKLGEQVYRTLLDRRIEDLNADLIFDLICYICKGEPGAILVFVPGLTDIAKIIGKMEKSNKFPCNLYEIYPLHSKLPSLEQKRIFNRPPHGVRKIVVATNIAETSITIDDVVYVIDSAKIKVTGLSVADNISTLSVEWVSQANLRQRRGRAGRVQSGVCYHLVTSHRAARLPARLLPELQRSSLLEPVLAVKRLRLGRAVDALAATPDPPALESVNSAITHLKRLGALDESETLTPLGWHLARLPVHPAAGKLLLLGALFGCLDRAASVAACWGFKDPFIMVIGKEKEADAAKSRLANGEPSDHVAISEALRMWEQLDLRRNDFAWEHFLSMNTLQLLCDMKKQFADNLKSMGFLPSGSIKSHWENRNADNLSVFKAVVAAALYPQIGTVKWIGMLRPNPRIIVRTPEEGRVDIHPSSTLSTPVSSKFGGPKRICSNPGANWHVYWMKQKTSKLFLFDLTLVHTMPLLFFGELHITDVENEPSDCYINISSIKVRCNKTTAQLLVQLRNLLDEVLATREATPGAVIQHGDFEENVLNAVIELITAEDEQTSYFEGEGDDSDQSDATIDLCG